MSTSFEPGLDFPAAVALGAVKDVSSYANTGAVSGLVADTDTDLTNLAGVSIPLPDNAGEALEIVSDNIGDTDVIRIGALGPDGAELEDIDVVLTGTTPVALPGLISRVNSAVSVGPDGFDGALSIQQAGGGTVFALLDAEAQQLLQGHYTIPAGKRWIVGAILGTMQKSGGTETDVVVRLLIKQFEQTKYRRAFGFGLQRSGDTSIEFSNKYPAAGTSPFDLKLQANSSAAGAAVLARVNGLIFEGGQ